MSVVGLDIGTTGCKAILFDDEGKALGQGAREYPISTPRPGWAEQDVDLVWELACEAVGEAMANVRGDPPRGLAISAQGEAVVPVDERGRPLRPAILGMDTRTQEENRWLAERFGEEQLYNRTGMPLHTINTLPKLLWLQRHEPDTWRAADRFLLYEDFFLARLGGRATISHCLASRTQMYDLQRGDWADDILEAIGLDRGRLAPLASPSGCAVGALRRDLAERIGAKQEVLLASGGHDQACAALGSGVCKAGLAMVSTGTAEVVEVALEDPTLNETLRQGNISVYRHVVPDLCLAMTLNHSGGVLLRWFRDTLCPAERDDALRRGEDPYAAILADAPEGPTGLLVLPHFSGSGTPWLDTHSRGAIVGLTLSTTRSSIAKAILEGVTFELRVNLELLRRGGIPIRELHAVGGGARSPLWLQLKADICQVPLRVPDVTEAACLGAALLASVATGVYPNVRTAAEHTVRLERRIEPQGEGVAEYGQRYRLYRQLYPALVGLHRRMQDCCSRPKATPGQNRGK
jgi:xylulokinase